MKKFLSLILSVIMVFTVLPFTVSAEVANTLPADTVIKSGEKYYISTVEDLKTLAKIVNEDGNTCEGASFWLNNDIAVNDGAFTIDDKGNPLYNGDSILPDLFTSISKFDGSFDGQGHTISGLYMNSALFKNCTNATIKNLNISNSLIINELSDASCGSLCSSATNTEFLNCKIDAIVISNASVVGGALGSIEKSTISGVRNYGNTYSLSNSSITGGTIGYVCDSDINNSCNQGDVTGYNCGGFIGRSSTNKTTTCYNSGNVIGQGECGGFSCELLPYDNGTEIRYNGTRPYVAKPDRSVKYCYTVGEVSGSDKGEFCYSYSGDIFEISYCFFVGELDNADANGYISLMYDSYVWEQTNNPNYDTADNIPLRFELFAMETENDMKFYGKGLGYCEDIENENSGFPIFIKYHNHIWSNYIYNNDGTETAICLCTGCEEKSTRECDSEEIRVGTIIEYGLYPQTEVTDNLLISEFEKLPKEWVSYGYYSGEDRMGSMASSDYMKYTDFIYNGEKYRAVTFSDYRPATTISKHPQTTYGVDGVWQAVSGYTVNKIYYFKYEPLKWRVLDPDKGMVISTLAIDSQAYSNTVYYKSSDAEYYNSTKRNFYASNYETSSIRNWLNNDFYNTAFSVKEQNNITTTTVSTKDNENGIYDSADTEDKLFIPSVEEVHNSSFGFISDETRVFLGTDYAKCQGLKTDDYVGSETFGYPLRVHLRTPYGSQSNCLISGSGVANFLVDNVYDSGYGIIPAMCLSNLEFSETEPIVSDVTKVEYVQQEDTHKDFTVTANGRKSMIQFMEPDGGTRTYDRYHKNVKITSYNSDGEVVNSMARDLAYEVWEIYSNMSVGNEIKVRGKVNGKWDAEKYSFTIEPYNPIISMELSATSGKKGPVPATVIADDKTEKVMFKMSDNTSVTVSTYTTDENGNRAFTGKAWMNEDGLNEIRVYIYRNSVWRQAGTFEYTVK